MTDREFRSGPASWGATRQAVHVHGLTPEAETDFLVQLGRRLHDTRIRLRMSRRELARRTGISERYLAQIEAGRGNVSIVLLLRIVSAVRQTSQ